MKQSEVEVGAVYEVRWHDGSLTDVKILGEKGHPIQSYGYHQPGGASYRTIGRKVRYRAINLATGRHVEIKSAAKLRRLVRGAA